MCMLTCIQIGVCVWVHMCAYIHVWRVCLSLHVSASMCVCSWMCVRACVFDPGSIWPFDPEVGIGGSSPSVGERWHKDRSRNINKEEFCVLDAMIRLIWQKSNWQNAPIAAPRTSCISVPLKNSYRGKHRGREQMRLHRTKSEKKSQNQRTVCMLRNEKGAPWTARSKNRVQLD